MFRVIFDETKQLVPVRSWAPDLPEGTLRQLQHIASQPYVVDFVAAMADAHVSEGVAVGTVFATEREVVPLALGGDLGCGMAALELDLDAGAVDRPLLERAVAALRRAIPTGSALHRGRGASVPAAVYEVALSTGALTHAREALAPRHLGTLGGGNHFLELDRDVDGRLWLLVHSGSRGLGAAIAAHHGRAAAAGQHEALAALDVETAPGAAYLSDLAWALSFARWNREALAARALEVLGDIVGRAVGVRDQLDIHHNFVARERWGGRELFVHRKGAVAVPRGARALIPGSMGTASYVVEGLGCADAFGSCSHGAGRVMSRREARHAIRPEALAESMRRVVYPADLSRALVEEAPAAYRDIREVLEAQADLVTRVRRLEPVAVVKG